MRPSFLPHRAVYVLTRQKKSTVTGWSSLRRVRLRGWNPTLQTGDGATGLLIPTPVRAVPLTLCPPPRLVGRPANSHMAVLASPPPRNAALPQGDIPWNPLDIDPDEMIDVQKALNCQQRNLNRKAARALARGRILGCSLFQRVVPLPKTSRCVPVGRFVRPNVPDPTKVGVKNTHGLTD